MSKEDQPQPPDPVQVMEDVEDWNSHFKNQVSPREYFESLRKEPDSGEVETYSTSFIMELLPQKSILTDQSKSIKRLAIDLAEDFPAVRQKAGDQLSDLKQKQILTSINLADLYEAAKTNYRLYKKLTCKTKTNNKTFQRNARRAAYWFKVKKITAKAAKLSTEEET